MISLALRGASLLGVGALLVMPGSPESLAMYGVLVTSICGLAKQIIDKRAERQERLDQHKFAMDDRDAAARARDTLLKGLEENTALTREASEKASAAYSEANHVNAKIATIAAAAIATAKQEAAYPPEAKVDL